MALPSDQDTDLGSMVGNTPIVWIGEPFTVEDHGFWAKVESGNPGGMKDRPALHMISCAKERGELAPGKLIVESTSGTLGLGLALAGIVFRHPVTLVTDSGIEPIVRRLLTAYGARIEMVDEPHPDGGWQQARLDRVRDLLAASPGAYCPDQYHNPDNVDGYTPMALELVAQLGRIDVLVCSVGTGGHSAGVSRVLRDFNRHLRVVGVDAIGSTIFGQPARKRLMRGLGSSIFPQNVDYDTFDEVHWVNPAESAWTCRRLARARYVTGGWSVGAVAHVAGWLARTEPRGTRIVAVFPDGPHRYFDTIYSDEYCRAHGLLSSAPRAQPEEISSATDREVRRWTRCTRIQPPGQVPAARTPI